MGVLVLGPEPELQRAQLVFELVQVVGLESELVQPRLGVSR